MVAIVCHAAALSQRDAGRSVRSAIAARMIFGGPAAAVTGRADGRDTGAVDTDAVDTARDIHQDSTAFIDLHFPGIAPSAAIVRLVGAEHAIAALATGLHAKNLGAVPHPPVTAGCAGMRQEEGPVGKECV